MKIVEKDKFNMLIADENKELYDKNYEDEENIYYFTSAFIPKNMTIEECKNRFEERWMVSEESME